MGLLSLVTTRGAIRAQNGFTWGPIKEVAYLFAGIFVTIIPALAILQAGEHGALAGLIRAVRTPAHYFWAAGGLSSFLGQRAHLSPPSSTRPWQPRPARRRRAGLAGLLGEPLRSETFIAY